MLINEKLIRAYYFYDIRFEYLFSLDSYFALINSFV